MSHTANIGHPRRQITDKTALLISAAAQTLIAQSFPRALLHPTAAWAAARLVAVSAKRLS